MQLDAESWESEVLVSANAFLSCMSPVIVFVIMRAGRRHVARCAWAGCAAICFGRAQPGISRCVWVLGILISAREGGDDAC